VVGVYLRVSSATQKTDSQRTDIEKWLDAHGVDQDQVEWFEDKESGTDP
jgi:DNA invertase Pin-like site-specific DNA recombinase